MKLEFYTANFCGDAADCVYPNRVPAETQEQLAGPLPRRRTRLKP